MPGSLPIGGIGGARPDGGLSDGSVNDGGNAFVNGRPFGYLWYAGVGLGAFLRDEVAISRDKGPGYLVAPSFDIKSFHDLAFDAAGNAWVIPTTGNQIVRLPAAALGRGAVPPTPDVIIHSDGLRSPQSLVFDGSGRLWVLNYAAVGFSTGNVIRFDALGSAQGTLTVTPSLTLNPGSSAAEQARFNQVTALALDSASNLWVSAVGDVLRIDRASSLQGDVTAQPAAVLSGGEAYASLAFDGRGSLWVTAAGGGYLALRFDNPSAYTGEVKPVPSARVHLAAGTATFAGGMAADADGSLWVAMSNQLVKLAGASALTGEVTPQPAVVLGLVGSPDLASKLVLWSPTH